MLKDMKKIGRQVLFLEATPENCRNGEGAFIRLKDGGILFGYTEFLKGTGLDHDVSQISGYVSYDEGETWTDKRILLERHPGAQNIMCVNFFRRLDGSLGMIHGEKYPGKNGVVTNRKYCKISYDEGKTWTEDILCYDREGYACMNHDRILRLASGRLILTLAHHSDVGYDTVGKFELPGYVVFTVSDDDGLTWRTLECKLRSPFNDKTQFQEPGLYQHEDGKLWLWTRTRYGSQFMAYSTDDGETWTEPQPSDFFTSPRSPMSLKRLGRYTIAVFNPIPTFSIRDPKKGPWGRSPLVCAVSTDDGVYHDERSFDKMFYLEDSLDDSYCYTALFAGEDYFLAAYYHSNGTDWCLNSTKMVKVRFDELA